MTSSSGSVSKRARLFAWLDRRFSIREILDRVLVGYSYSGALYARIEAVNSVRDRAVRNPISRRRIESR